MLMHGGRWAMEEYVVLGSSLMGAHLFGFLDGTGYTCVFSRTCLRLAGLLPSSNRVVGAWFPGRPSLTIAALLTPISKCFQI